MQDSQNPYLKEPCSRCGGKKYIAKSWKETIDTYTGTTVIEYSQIVCTNKACQEEFEKNLADETRKKELAGAKRGQKDPKKNAYVISAPEKKSSKSK